MPMPDSIRYLFAEVRANAADGFTLVELGSLLHALATLAVEAAAKFANTTGPEKKLWAMAQVADLLDLVLPALPLPIWLVPVAPFVRSLARRLLLALADGLIEAAYDRFKTTV